MIATSHKCHRFASPATLRRVPSSMLLRILCLGTMMITVFYAFSIERPLPQLFAKTTLSVSSTKRTVSTAQKSTPTVVSSVGPVTESTMDSTAGSQQKEKTGVSCASETISTHASSFFPGELPGYTGWARPAKTRAHHFRVVKEEWQTKESKTSTDSIYEWTVWIQEHSPPSSRLAPICLSSSIGNSKFFARAYGPAIVMGRVEPMIPLKNKGDLRPKNTTRKPGEGEIPTALKTACIPVRYRISFPFMSLPVVDPYFVEIVMTFSQAPLANELPLHIEKEEPSFEGYMIPGFPRLLNLPTKMSRPIRPRNLRSNREAFDNDNDKNKDPSVAPCLLPDLLVTGLDEEIGSWIVTKRTHHTDSNDEEISYQGYELGGNSLGVETEYKPHSCSLSNEQEEDLDLSDIFVIFMGDSNMRMQKLVFQRRFGNAIPSVLISTSGGIYARFSNITLELDQILSEVRASKQAMKHNHSDVGQTRTKIVLLYNTGIHDVAQLCNQNYITNINFAGRHPKSANYSCVEVYQSFLADLTSMVLEHDEIDHVVFQTTTAAWPKWGNFGFAWPTDKGQPYSLSPDFIQEMNRVAIPTIVSASHNDGQEKSSRENRLIPIMDGFWITYARPDHREISPSHEIGKHLVHAGVKVVWSMTSIWMAILRELVELR